MTNNEPIDFAHLAKYTLNDRVLEAEVLGLFVEQLPQTLDRLRNARTEQDWRAAAHTIKGSAQAVGAGRLAAAAAAAEVVMDQPDAQPVHLARLTQEIEIAVTYVSQSQVAAERALRRDVTPA